MGVSSVPSPGAVSPTHSDIQSTFSIQSGKVYERVWRNGPLGDGVGGSHMFM